jgi:hypothetical protein
MKTRRNLQSPGNDASAVQGTLQEKLNSAAAANRAALEESILYEATGSRRDAATRLLFQAGSALKLGANDHEAHLTDAFAMMKEIAPQNSLESLLAIQMLAVHEAALVFLMNGAKDGQNVDVAYDCINRATSLTRVFVQQLEAMQKLKGKTGQQKVTVKHVHVHQGGQAIVGAVTRADAKLGEGGVGDE